MFNVKNEMRKKYQVNWTTKTRFRMALPKRSGGGGGGGGGGAGGNGGVVMLVTSNLTPTGSTPLGTFNPSYKISDGTNQMVFQTFTSASNSGFDATGGTGGTGGNSGSAGELGTSAGDGGKGSNGYDGREGVAAVIFV